MEFGILGPLVVRSDAGAMVLGGARPRAVLAVLLLHPNESVSAERLAVALFGEDAAAGTVKTVRVHVSRLRRALGDPEVLTTTTDGYRLRVHPDELDAERFERLTGDGQEALRAGQPERAAAVLREALGLWRGPPLGELADVPFAAAEVARLEEQRLAALEARVEADLAVGRHAELIGELRQLTSTHPLRERLQGQLMLALYRGGRQADALQAYRRARELLVDGLGIEPGHELRGLEQSILRQDPRLDFAARERADEAPSGAFVGRASELGQLVAGLDDALTGQGRLVLIGGEPGIGKSRLADELGARARARDALVLVGRCWEAGGAPAYWPWTQSLRSYVRDADTATLRSQLEVGAVEVARLVPELRGRLPDLGEPPSLEAEGARFRLFDATSEFLRRACERRPIVLVLDDLHAADVPSLLLLRFLARELGSMRMLVLAAYRDVDPRPGPALGELLAALVREPVTRRVSLGGLSKGEAAEYVDLMAPEIASAQLVAALHEETEGNPLFVGEIVRLLATEGIEAPSTAEVRRAVPRSLRDVIARRLTHLSDECNRVLVLASVLGREFALAPLAHMGDVSEDELLGLADEAIADRVLSDLPAGAGRLRFAHVLIRDTLYDGLTGARRVRLHRQAVQALEALYGGKPGPHLSELAHHAMAGSKFEQAVAYARRAGDRELALLAYEESARNYELALRALDLTDDRDEGVRCELLLSLGDAQSRAGDDAAAKRAFLDAAGLAQRGRLPRELARAALGYGGRIVSGRGDERLVPLLEAGLAALSDDEVELRARLLARLAGALGDERWRDRRDRLSTEAVELARRTGNPTVLAHALDGRGRVIFAPDTVRERLALGGEMREAAEQAGDGELVAQACLHRMVALLQLGDIAAASSELTTVEQVAHQLKQPVTLWEGSIARAMLALATGPVDESEALVARALAEGQRAAPEFAIPTERVQRYELCDLRGSSGELEPAIRELVAQHPARPVLRCMLAHLHARNGQTTEAKPALADLVRDDCAAIPFDHEWLHGMSLLAETAALLGDTSSAPLLYRLLLPYGEFNVENAADAIRGSVARYLGLLASTLKRWQNAQVHFESALGLNSSMGARPWLAHTQHDYARMLHARNKAGDRQHAVDLIRHAFTTYRELGMNSWAAQASQLEQELRAAPAPPR